MKALFSKSMVYFYRNNPPGMQRILKPVDELKKSILEQEIIPIELNHEGPLSGTAFNLGWDAERNQPLLDVELDEKIVKEHAPHVLGKEEIAVSPQYKFDFEAKKGVYNGQEYDGIARNIKWRKLAIIHDKTQLARCGISDGCRLKLTQNDAVMHGNIAGMISIDAVILPTIHEKILPDSDNLTDDKALEVLQAEHKAKLEEQTKVIDKYKAENEAFKQQQRLDLVQRASKYKIKEEILKEKSSDFLEGILHMADWANSEEYKKLVTESAADAIDIKYEKITPAPPGAPKKSHTFTYKPVKPKEVGAND